MESSNFLMGIALLLYKRRSFSAFWQKILEHIRKKDANAMNTKFFFHVLVKKSFKNMFG